MFSLHHLLVRVKFFYTQIWVLGFDQDVLFAESEIVKSSGALVPPVGMAFEFHVWRNCGVFVALESTMHA